MLGEKRLFGVMKTDDFCLSERNAFAISLSATGSLQAEPNKKKKKEKGDSTRKGFALAKTSDYIKQSVSFGCCLNMCEWS